MAIHTQSWFSCCTGNPWINNGGQECHSGHDGVPGLGEGDGLVCQGSCNIIVIIWNELYICLLFIFEIRKKSHLLIIISLLFIKDTITGKENRLDNTWLDHTTDLHGWSHSPPGMGPQWASGGSVGYTRPEFDCQHVHWLCSSRLCTSPGPPAEAGSPDRSTPEIAWPLPCPIIPQCQCHFIYSHQLHITTSIHFIFQQWHIAMS